MANTVTVRKLLDSPHTAIFSVYLKSDGTGTELSKQVVIDPAVDFTPNLKPGMRMKLNKVWYSLAGFDLRFEFDTMAPYTEYPIWVLPASTESACIDFTPFGGLVDNSGIDASGKLMLTSTGFTTTADQGSLIIQVSKITKTYQAP